MIFRKAGEDSWDYCELIPESLLDKVCLKIIEDKRISVHSSQKKAYEILMEYFYEAYGIGEDDGIAYAEGYLVCEICEERSEKKIDFTCDSCLEKALKGDK